MTETQRGPALQAAIDAVMNEWGSARGLPALKWRRAELSDSELYGVHPSKRGSAAEAEAARSWGRALGFRLSPYSDDESGFWSGTIDDWDVNLDYGPDE